MKRTAGFTLVELLVVVSIVVVLIAMLLPAMEGAIEQGKRARCAANLHAISIGAATYGLENRAVLFICRGRSVQIAFDALGGVSPERPRPEDRLVDWPAALASVGLAGSAKGQAGTAQDYSPSKVWDCPSRGFESYWDTQYAGGGGARQMIVSYAYYGGIELWENPNRMAGMPSASPLRTTDPGRWTLGSDYTIKYLGVWGGAEAANARWAFGTPAHRRERNLPAGQNQMYLDGSVEWVDAKELVYIHSWFPAVNIPMYFRQTDLNGWTPPDSQYLRADPDFGS